MPNMYARGILFGKMVLELGDSCTAKNDKNDLSAEIEFKTKVHTHPYSPVPLPYRLTQGFFSGTYNALAGRLKHGSTDEVGEVSGKWSDIMEFKFTKVRASISIYPHHR
jgi:hypothetical protein